MKQQVGRYTRNTLATSSQLLKKKKTFNMPKILDWRPALSNQPANPTLCSMSKCLFKVLLLFYFSSSFIERFVSLDFVFHDMGYHRISQTPLKVVYKSFF